MAWLNDHYNLRKAKAENKEYMAFAKTQHDLTGSVHTQMV